MASRVPRLSGLTQMMAASDVSREGVDQGRETTRERKTPTLLARGHATARSASGRYGGSMLSQSMDFSSSGVKLSTLQPAKKDTKPPPVWSVSRQGSKRETTIDPNAYLPRNSSSVSSIRHDVLPRTQRPSFGSSRGSSLRSSDGGDLLAAAMAAPAAPRTARMASTGGRHEHDDRLQRLVKDSDALKQLHSCLEEQLEGLKEKLLSSEATNISLQQGSASLQLEHSALQDKYKRLSEEQQATQQQLRATQVELRECRERLDAASTTSETYTRALSQAMCSLGGLTQGVSAPLEAAAEEIQMTQARLIDAQAQLQAQAAEHTEHLKWRFAEEEEMRMESEELRRRTQETEDLVAQLKSELMAAAVRLEASDAQLLQEQQGRQELEAEHQQLMQRMQQAQDAAVTEWQTAAEVSRALLEAQAAKARAEGEADGWRAKFEEGRKWAEELEGETSRLQLSCRASAAAAEAARQEAERVRSELEAAFQQLEGAKGEVATARDLQAELQAQVTVVQQAEAEAKADAKQAVDKAVREALARAEAERAMADVRSRLEQLQAEAEELRAAAASSSRQLEEASGAWKQDMQQRLVQLEEQLRQAEEERAGWQQARDAAVAEARREADRQLADAAQAREADAKRSACAAAEVAQALSEARAAAESRQAEVELLQKALQDRRAELAAARTQLEALSAARLQQQEEQERSVQAAQGQAAADVAALKEELQALHAAKAQEAQQAQTATAATEEANLSAQAARDQALAQAAELTEQLAAVRQQLGGALAEAEAAEERCADLQAQVQQLQAQEAEAVAEAVTEARLAAAAAAAVGVKQTASRSCSPMPQSGGDGRVAAPRSPLASPAPPLLSPLRLPPAGSFKHLCDTQLAELLGLRDQQLQSLKGQLDAAADEAETREKEMELLQERVRVNAALRQRVEDLEEALRAGRDREREGERRLRDLEEVVRAGEAREREVEEGRQRLEELEAALKEATEQLQEEGQAEDKAESSAAMARDSGLAGRRRRGVAGTMAAMLLRVAVLGGATTAGAVLGWHRANRYRSVRWVTRGHTESCNPRQTDSSDVASGEGAGPSNGAVAK